MINSRKSLVRTEGVTAVALADIRLHPLVTTHPVMVDEQFLALKSSLLTNHQIEPVVLYRGKVIDGRHRCAALTELGSDVVYTVSLSNNLTLKEAKAFVDASETRRHQTATQLAIKAYDYWKLFGCTQQEATAATGGSLSNLQHVAKIAKLGRLDILDRLRSGGKVNVSDVATYKKYTDSLLAIVRMVSTTDTKYKHTADRELTSEDYVKINAIVALVAGWSVKEKQVLVAKIYETMK